MRVKSQHYLQPTVVDAHSVVVEDSRGNILFVAVEAGGNSILAAQAGDKDFNDILKALGIDKVTYVTEFKPKSIEEMKNLL